MKFKSALLATAAAVVSTSAFAADAVVEKAPVAANYVKICDSFGAGYFYIPGSDTCLKIQGRIRVLGVYNANPAAGASDAAAFADGRVEFVLSQATELGRSDAGIRFKFDGSGGKTTFAGDNSLSVDDAYIAIGDFAFGSRIRGDKVFSTANGVDLSSYGAYDTFNLSNAASGRFGSTNLGARFTHDWGNGLTTEAAAELRTSALTASQLLGNSGADPILSLSATYKNGPFKGAVIGAYDTGNTSGVGGYGLGAVGEYTIVDGWTGKAGVSYTSTPASGTTTKTGWTNAFVGTQYAITKQISVYGDYGYIAKNGGASNVNYVNAGVDYTIAKNLIASVEETYVNGTSAIAANAPTGVKGWTTILMLNRKF